MTPHAASYADRVIFLADGKIVRELSDPTEAGVLEAIKEVGSSMTKVTLKGLAMHKTRAVLTTLAVVIGVAMISGAYVVSDTMLSAANSLSTSAYNNTDAVVSAKTAFTNGDNVGSAVTSRRARWRRSARTRTSRWRPGTSPSRPSSSTRRARSSAAARTSPSGSTRSAART